MQVGLIMDISGVSQSLSAISASGSQARAGDAQNNPLATLQNKEAAAQSQLSVFGKVRLTLDDLRSSAQALKNFSKPPTLSDFKIAVQGFVQSFNNLQKTVSDASAGISGKNALSSDARPGQVLNEVRNAITGPNRDNLPPIQKLGVEPQKDGTFAINQKSLDRTFQNDRAGVLATFSAVSDRVGAVIDKQLSASGAVGKKVQDLSVRVADLENTHNRAQERLDSQKSFQQRLAAQLANAGGYVARNAVTTYLNVATM